MRVVLVSAALALSACMTGLNDETCLWRPGSDGSCPDNDSSSSSSSPDTTIFHAFTDPLVAGFRDAHHVIMNSEENTAGLHQRKRVVVHPGGVSAPAYAGEMPSVTGELGLACGEVACLAVWRE